MKYSSKACITSIFVWDMVHSRLGNKVLRFDKIVNKAISPEMSKSLTISIFFIRDGGNLRFSMKRVMVDSSGLLCVL